LVGDPLTVQQARDIAISRVVHTSIDPSIAPTLAASKDDDEGDAGKDDPDRVITNARQARSGDGLLSDEELCSLFQSQDIVRSAYDEGQRCTASEQDNIIGSRMDNIAPERKGSFEPMWTSYTYYWKTTLGNQTQGVAEMSVLTIT
jgi:RNA exonuclease NGL2